MHILGCMCIYVLNMKHVHLKKIGPVQSVTNIHTQVRQLSQSKEKAQGRGLIYNLRM